MYKFLSSFINTFILLWILMFLFAILIKLLIISIFFAFHNSWLFHLVMITIVSCFFATERIIQDNKKKPKNITVSSVSKAKV